MLKILKARLQQYVNRELPDVQAGFRKGRGTRDQIANICWIMKKARVTGIVGTKYKSIFLSPFRCESLRCIFLLKDGASGNERESVIDET